MQSFLFGSPCTLELVLDNIENRKHLDIQTDNATEKLPLYIGNESVKGVAKVLPKEGKKLEHQGIVLELIGQIGKQTPFICITNFGGLFFDVLIRNVLRTGKQL